MLRQYQIAAIDGIYNSLLEGNKAPLIAMPTGTGKSLALAGLVHRTCSEYPQTRHIILSHVSEILQQDYDAIKLLWPTAPVGVYSAGLRRRDTMHPIIVGGCASVIGCVEKFGHRDFAIIDECFTGDTLVATPDGEKRIDSLRVGDVVLNATGYGEIVSTRQRAATTVTVRLSNGTEIETTPNHPFFTDSGWVNAASLARGARVFSAENVSALWESVRPELVAKKPAASAGKSVGETNLLLNILQSEAQQSNERGGESAKNARYAPPHQTCSDLARRKWASFTTSAISSFTRAWRGLGGGGRNKDERGPFERRISERLQGRHSQSGNDASNRNRRWLACWRKAARGSKERSIPHEIRVESVSHNERAGAVPVFNLHVNGHPSYFAGGVLVHNCHLLSPESESTYQKIIATLREINPKLVVVGLTATPYRRGIGTLLNNGVFDSMAIDLTDKKSWARFIAEGYLVPLHAKKTEAKIDVKGLRIVNGDYSEKDLQAASDKEELNQAIAKEIWVAAETRKATLVFCAGIEHAEHMAEELRIVGMRAEAIHSKMDRKDRDKFLEMFKRGELDALTNNNCLTTGVNVPRIDLIAMCRATVSVNLWVQMLGRGSRPAPDKNNCLVLDFAGNRPRLGPVDDPYVPKPAVKGEKPGEIPVKVCGNCGCYAHISARVCENCGTKFDIKTKLSNRAGEVEIMSTELPVIKKFPVLRLTCARHMRRADGAPIVRVTYLCGRNYFNAWLNFESPRQLHFAKQWWLQHVGDDIPTTNDEALALLSGGCAVTPAKVNVWVNKGKYPEIIGYEF